MPRKYTLGKNFPSFAGKAILLFFPTFSKKVMNELTRNKKITLHGLDNLYLVWKMQKNDY